MGNLRREAKNDGSTLRIDRAERPTERREPFERCVAAPKKTGE
jgi:hypothetical protein